MRDKLFKKAWELFGENHCFLCGKSLEQHIKETGKGFDLYCRTEDFYLMEAWNWKTVCRDCLPAIEGIENQVID